MDATFRSYGTCRDLSQPDWRFLRVLQEWFVRNAKVVRVHNFVLPVVRTVHFQRSFVNRCLFELSLFNDLLHFKPFIHLFFIVNSNRLLNS